MYLLFFWFRLEIYIYTNFGSKGHIFRKETQDCVEFEKKSRIAQVKFICQGPCIFFAMFRDNFILLSGAWLLPGTLELYSMILIPVHIVPICVHKAPAPVGMGFLSFSYSFPIYVQKVLLMFTWFPLLIIWFPLLIIWFPLLFTWYPLLCILFRFLLTGIPSEHMVPTLFTCSHSYSHASHFESSGSRACSRGPHSCSPGSSSYSDGSNSCSHDSYSDGSDL